MTRARPTSARCWPLVLAATLAHATPALAASRLASQQEPCRPAPVAASGTVWPAPLDRALTLDARDVSLRAALDRVAAAAKLRLSYAPDFLPLERRVCDRFDRVPAGDALVALLRGTTLRPVASGPDQVVLAPQQDAALPPERRRIDVLERIVVTGSADGAPQRALTVGLDVVRTADLGAHETTRIDRLLDGAVPGLWVWEQSPSSVLARYGSIRGASSFGVSYPKIYLDGIEVANPLLLTDLGPASISHIEVIRGPQGAALYGTDAISGVVNVVTRHEGVAPDGRRLQLRSRVGLSQSDFARDALAQEHALSVRAGSSTRSAGLAASLGTIGDFLPNGASRRVAVNGDARVVGTRGTLSATARLFEQRSGAGDNPLLAGAPVAALPETYPEQSARQYTVGTTGTLRGGERWTHRATAGVDGYRLGNLALQADPFSSTADSALRAAHGGADRATMRVASSAQVGLESRAVATFTVAGELSALREESAPVLAPAPLLPTDDATRWRRNAGLTAQAQVGLRDALFATAGLRVERSSGYVRDAQTSLLPMLGAAWVVDAGATSLKLRAAYGKGIRPVRATLRPEWMAARGFDASSLAPEQQAGIESGVDFTLGDALSVHLTRFDQRALGLIQAVAVSWELGTTSAPGGGTLPPRPRIAYQLQNVGEIANRGWELQASGTAGPLTVGGTLSLVDSRVERVAPGYGGELRPGDRMLEVPARTASLNAAWTSGAWDAALGLSRAADWVNYDRARLAADAEAGGDPHALTGTRLREYWRTYDGVTRLRASLSRTLLRDLTGVLAGDNLLGTQRGEPDDVTIVPGRTITAGVRVRF